MALINSISGIRGTIGPGEDNLNSLNYSLFVLAFAEFLKRKNEKKKKIKIVIGRDSRISGPAFLSLAVNNLIFLGIDVLNVDLATTPTIEMAVINEKADGGIIISASHNPKEWNALKLLNFKGEFLDKKSRLEISKIFQKKDFSFVSVDKIAKVEEKFNYEDFHIEKILKLSLLDIDKIEKADFKVVVDGVNSVGSLVVPKLLKKLGLKNIVVINNDIDGRFNHNPEPIDRNLKQLSVAVKKLKADLGIAVDPDVDRLALVDEKAEFFGEEYSLIAVSDYVLKKKRGGNTVSNLSSSQALEDLSLKYGGRHYYSAVGELNVVDKMKKVRAVIGGEGNGGIIYPELHYGRDALVGIALFLSYLAEEKKTCSEIKKNLPSYFILKKKVEIKGDIKKIFSKIEKDYKKYDIIKKDGLKIVLKKEKAWIHLRASNTEPIIRLYCEALNKKEAFQLLNKIKKIIYE
jgi:phosphomannomutase